MIQFTCEHCGNAMRMPERYAGRDGWCRVCLKMIIVPKPGGPSRLSELSPKHREKRLMNLLQYAATMAYRYRDQLKQYQDEGSHSLLDSSPSLGDHHASMPPAGSIEQHLADVEAQLGESKKAQEQAEAALATERGLRRDAESQADAVRLSLEDAASKLAAVERDRGAREDVESKLEVLEAELSSVRNRLAEEATARESAEQARDEERASREATEVILQSIEASAKSERPSFEDQLQEKTVALETAQAALDEARAALLASEQTLEAERVSFQTVTREFEQVRVTMESLSQRHAQLERDYRESRSELVESRAMHWDSVVQLANLQDAHAEVLETAGELLQQLDTREAEQTTIAAYSASNGKNGGMELESVWQGDGKALAPTAANGGENEPNRDFATHAAVLNEFARFLER